MKISTGQDVVFQRSLATQRLVYFGGVLGEGAMARTANSGVEPPGRTSLVYHCEI